MTTELILRSFLHNDHSITVPFTGEAFFNATVAAKAFGKLPGDWLRNKETQKYVGALRAALAMEQDQLVIVRQGGYPNEQGTWLHPKLVVAFARWLSHEFAVWCDMQVEEILRGQPHAAAPEPRFWQNNPDYYDFDQKLGDSQKIVIEFKTFSRLCREKDQHQRLYEAALDRLVVLQNKHIALLKKLAKRGIKP
ncbi:MAG: KilA-N domain-containing protein [Candidatus Competibacter sp.]|jgi:hypothetical protein|nr:KilA-N domain-containing protein [Candidatus Competibacteraceae bacterium]